MNERLSNPYGDDYREKFNEVFSHNCIKCNGKINPDNHKVMDEIRVSRNKFCSVKCVDKFYKRKAEQ